MSFVASEHPGVFLDYVNSSITYSNYNNRIVGIVGKATLKPEGIVYITNTKDAAYMFGDDSALANLCTIALKNGAYKIAAVAVDGSSSSYNDAFDLLANQNNICAVMCDSQNLTIHKLLQTSINTASNNTNRRIGIIGCGINKNVLNWAKSFNNERIVLIAQHPIDDNKSILSSSYIGAAMLGLIAKNADPTSSLNGSLLNNINNLSANLSENDIDNYIKSGITTFECNNSKVKLIRAVTSRTKTNGTLDTTFRDLNTTLIIDDIISSISQTLASFIKEAKNNKTTLSAISTQSIIKLEEYMDLNIINSYKSPQVFISENDPSVCIVKLEFSVLKGLNQINISAHLNV